LASRDQDAGKVQAEIIERQRDLVRLQEELRTVSANMARAKNNEQYVAIAAEFDRLQNRESELMKELETAESQAAKETDMEAEVNAALGLILRLTELAGNPDDLKAAGEIIRLANVNLYLGFRPVKVKKRTLNKLAGGVVTFGDARPPISIYAGATSREKVKGPVAAATGTNAEVPPPHTDLGGEGKSLGNVNRGDWI